MTEKPAGSRGDPFWRKPWIRGLSTSLVLLPMAFDKRIGPAVAKAVAQAARDSGVARL